MTFKKWVLLGTIAATSGGCTGALERNARTALDDQPSLVSTHSAAPPAQAEPAEPFDGTLGGYVKHALQHSPRLRERYAQWQAQVARIDSMRALPEPTLRYTVFLSRVETRVGPQRHRVGITQAFPWPTKLSAGVDGASYAAQSAARRYEAEALLVVERVAAAYWSLWLLTRKERVLREQQQMLRALSDAARGRLEVGNAGLAHLSQAQLAISRLQDTRDGLTRVRARREAALRRVLSAPATTALPIRKTMPPQAAIGESLDGLLTAIAGHPAIDSVALMAASKRAFAERAEAEGLPRFSLGADWIEIGPATVGDPPDSGKDAVSITVGITVPLWRHVYAAKEDAALAESRALLARRDAAEDNALAEFERARADIADTLRQARLYRSTLIPQAETTLEASLGEYQVGQLGFAAALLAQRDLFALQLGHDRALAEHQQAWARLEAVVGRKVAAAAAEVTP